MKKACIYIFLLLYVNVALCQAEGSVNADSLKKLISITKNDTTKAKLLAMAINVVDIPDLEIYTKQLLILSDKLLNDNALVTFRSTAKKCKATALTGIGFLEDSNNNTIKAIEYYKQSLALQEEIHDTYGAATTLNNLSEAYRVLGDIEKALAFNKQSLKLWEELKNERNAATAMHNLAGIYVELNDDDKALEYYKRSLAIFEKTPDGYGVEFTLNSIGGILNRHGKFKEALSYNLRSLKVAEKHGSQESIATALNSIGTYYQRFNNVDSAIYYYKNSVRVARKNDDKRSLFYTFNNFGGLFLEQKKFALAHSYADSSAHIAKMLGFPVLLRYSEVMLSRVDSATGNFESAFAHYKRSIVFKDSINNEKNRKAVIRNQLNYEFEKKEAVIKAQQEKERLVAKEKNRFQQIIIFSVIAGFVLVMIFAAFILRSLKTTRHQKIIIEEKQREILDSIRYAKRIQTSLLPTEKYIEKILKR